MEIREELERMVVSGNSFLRLTIKEMDYVTLLRNVHPSYRPDFTYRLLRKGLITSKQAAEFVKVVGYTPDK